MAWTLNTAKSDSLVPDNFWNNMSNELFEHVWGLYTQIDAYFPLRSSEDGFPAIIVGF
jgi:hypothetical protein